MQVPLVCSRHDHVLISEEIPVSAGSHKISFEFVDYAADGVVSECLIKLEAIELRGVAGGGTSDTCVSCPAGTTIQDGVYGCVKCPSGHISAGGGEPCTPCSENTYAHEVCLLTTQS